jgi:Protein of unknown function (DUF4238)
MTDPKRHHWWPECHSKLWVDNDGLITAIDQTGHSFRSPPSKVGVQTHHNSIRMPDGTIDTSLETFFANEIETPVAPILLRLANQSQRSFAWDQHIDRDFASREARAIRSDGFLPTKRGRCVLLSAAERRAVARYFASLLVRVPSYKDELRSTAVIAEIRKVLGLSESDAKFETDVLHVEIVTRHLNDYATRLLECAWLVIESSEQEILFSDTPVVPSALGWGDAEAICPISPNRCMMMVRGYKPPIEDSVMIIQSTPQSTRGLNQTLLQNSQRFVFCRSPFPSEFVVRHFGSRQARIVPIFQDIDNVGLEGPMLG